MAARFRTALLPPVAPATCDRAADLACGAGRRLDPVVRAWPEQRVSTIARRPEGGG